MSAIPAEVAHYLTRTTDTSRFLASISWMLLQLCVQPSLLSAFEPASQKGQLGPKNTRILKNNWSSHLLCTWLGLIAGSQITIIFDHAPWLCHRCAIVLQMCCCATAPRSHNPPTRISIPCATAPRSHPALIVFMAPSHDGCPLPVPHPVRSYSTRIHPIQLSVSSPKPKYPTEQPSISSHTGHVSTHHRPIWHLCPALCTLLLRLLCLRFGLGLGL